MATKDTDDVLDFINSLPDSNRGTPVAKKEGEGSEDFLEFLDELSAHEKAKPSAAKSKFEPKKREEKPAPATAAEPVAESTEKPADSADIAVTETKETEEEDAAGDPLTSISSWWTSEGSLKVSSLWGSIASNAQQIGESTYQLASNTSQQLSHQRQKMLQESGVAETDQIVQIGSRLNLILHTMSQQIKDGLIDKEDELLNVLLVYDLTNVEYLDRLCASRFNRVMGQVEGGIKVTVNNFNHKHEQRSESRFYNLDMFHGKVIDGEKLCFANLESSIKDYVKITDIAAEENSEINKSNVFIAIQPITTGTAERSEDEQLTVLIEASNADSFAFTMILKDITNNITIVSKSQPFPMRWARWVAGDREDVDKVFGVAEDVDSVDPSEWVKGWIQDGLGLSFAVLAQEYVTKRMGL